MLIDSYNIVAIMSGTSLDGIDIIHLNFKYNNGWEYTVIDSETVSYTDDWNEVLRDLVHCNMDGLKAIDQNYTTYLATVINKFIDKNNIKNIHAVCSHGHTALHQPHKGITYQIGNLPKLASLIHQTVVCDFRVEDVALGGQGAPLVPIGDQLLFKDYTFCINLGGFANISTENHQQRIAYDICPVNIVLNHYVKQLGFDYDDKGLIAASGDINTHLLEALNALEFYAQVAPKSLGLEWVSKHIFPLIDRYDLAINVILKTFIEHVAIQICKAINIKTTASVLITGGGVYNTYLIQRIQALTPHIITQPDDETVEFKEAIIFGLLGVLKLRNEINCLSSVTGASKNHSSGKIYII